MRLLASVVLGLFLLGSSVSSVRAGDEYSTVGHLMRACSSYISKNTEELLDIGFCGGFVKGVGDVLSGLQKAQLLAPVYCTPSNATGDQMARIFVKYAEDHPETHHKLSVIGFIGAMKEAFPCPAK